MATGDVFTAEGLAAVAWRTSTRSGSGGGGNCVEVGVWRTSTRSGSAGGSNCVEVGADATHVLVRDSKDRDGGLLAVSSTAWTTFTGTLKADRLA